MSGGGATVQTTAILLMIAIRGTCCSQEVALVPLIMIHQAAVMRATVAGQGKIGQNRAGPQKQQWTVYT